MIEIDEAGTARVDTVAEALSVVDNPGVKDVVVRDKDEERKLWGLARALMSGQMLTESELKEATDANDWGRD